MRSVTSLGLMMIALPAMSALMASRMGSWSDPIHLVGHHAASACNAKLLVGHARRSGGDPKPLVGHAPNLFPPSPPTPVGRSRSSGPF